MHMNQQTVNSNTDPYSNGQTSSSESLSLVEAIWHLPRQYIKVLCRPSAQTFCEAMGKASWGIVLVQFYALFVITVTLSYLAHLIPSSALHTTSAFSIGSFKPFAFLPSPYNGITFILGSFLIGLVTAYLFSKLWQGQGRFLAHAYSLLLCTIPLVSISGALLLIPATGVLITFLITLIFVLFVYRMLLHVFIIMGVHGLSAGKATLIVLIIPMFFVGLALILLTEGIALEGLFGTIDWFPGKSEKQNNTKTQAK